MKKYAILFVLTGIILVAVGLTCYKIYSQSDYKVVEVESGLKVLFLKDDSLPFIQFKALFPKAGLDYDFSGKSGLAKLTALN